ncbi:MAG TPA: adenylyltransferase [Elusimicrobia bacterium]|nr:adenylyltransferase [Elusimicrobiota bacterium]HBT61377.1 adenylyltransferase [Elusimicrobiota bacterium]
MTLSGEELRRYRRHLALAGIGRRGQEKLKAAKVLCVGAGGLGSPLAFYLAAAGIGRLGLVDDGRLELSNLQRQILYATRGLGQPKAAQAAARLRALNPHVQVQVLPLRLSPDNAAALISGYDVIADATDNFPARYALNAACAAAGRPMVHGAVSGFEGYLSVFWAKRGPCYRCFLPTTPAAPTPQGPAGAVPGAIGALQALEILKLILGIGKPLIGRLLLFDGLSGEWRCLRVKKDPKCPSCRSCPK